MYIEIVSKHSNNINRGLRDTAANKSGEHNVKCNEIFPALTTYISYLMNNTVTLNTPFCSIELRGEKINKKIPQNKSTWSLSHRRNINMSTYYWLDELEFKSQNPRNIRIRDLVEYRLPEYASDY